VSGLTIGITYRFTVAAVSENGEERASALSTTIVAGTGVVVPDGGEIS
jgi:hypothetical protein